MWEAMSKQMYDYLFDLNKMEKILNLNIGVNQADNHELFSILSSIHTIKIHRYSAGREHNGWVVPHQWNVHKALIIKDDRIVFDGAAHPMAVAGYSSSFSGVISKETLDKHVFYNADFPTAYGFHKTYNYRPWQKHWGFCIPYETYSSWGKGMYQIELVTSFDNGDMLVGEWSHQGESKDTIVFNAHSCHPCQANDDMVGVFVLAALFKWLEKRKTNYSYLGVIAPEHVGTVFYLADIPPQKRDSIKLGCFVEMVGTKGPLRLQQSFTGKSRIDLVAQYVLQNLFPSLEPEPFRSVVGNDETVWEAPGIEIPMISISRWPYPEYHTSLDNVKLISQSQLNEALEVLKQIINVIESDRFAVRKFEGLIALSNPKYELYIERDDPVVPKFLNDLDRKMGYLQDHLPRYLNGSTSVLDLSLKFHIPFDFLSNYLLRFEEKDLVKLIKVPLEHNGSIAGWSGIAEHKEGFSGPIVASALNRNRKS